MVVLGEMSPGRKFFKHLSARDHRGFLMNHFVKASVATAVVLGTSLVAGSAFAGIANTKHNLGSLGTQTNKTDGTGEICIFCHTPHGGDNTAPVPLWNKSLTDSTFTTYDQLGTSTLDAGVLDVGSVSLACLTCHDGTQAIDNIINAPGSGGFDTTGGGDVGLNWAWNTGNTLDNNGQFIAGAVVNLGVDLTNDHPISVQYGGGGITTTGGTTNDKDFVQPVALSGNRWYVPNTLTSGAVAGFDKWDFKLYTRDTSSEAFRNTATSTANGPEPFVECGSCHDPHFETTTFLRMDGVANSTTASEQSNRGSRVCLTCHTK